MKRKSFIKSTAFGIGAFPFTTLFISCKSDAKEKKAESSKLAEPTTDPKIVENNQGLKLNVRGDNQTIKLTGEDTNGQFALIEQNNEPGVGIPRHVHENEDEVFQVLTGKVEVTIGDQITTLNAGDIIFCPKRIPHSWKVIGEAKARCMLSIFPAGLEEMFKEVAELPPGSPDPEKIREIRRKYKIKFV